MREREPRNLETSSDESRQFSTSWERQERAVYTVEAMEREFKALMPEDESSTVPDKAENGTGQ